MAMKTCPGCGRMYSDAMSSSICPKCGATIGMAMNQQPSQKSTQQQNTQQQYSQQNTQQSTQKQYNQPNTQQSTQQQYSQQNTQQSTQQQKQTSSAASKSSKKRIGSWIVSFLVFAVVFFVVRGLVSGEFFGNSGPTVNEADIISTTTHDKYIALLDEAGIPDKDYYSGKHITMDHRDISGVVEKIELGYSGDRMNNAYLIYYYPYDDTDVGGLMEYIDELKSQHPSEVAAGYYDIVTDSIDNYLVVIEQYKKMDTQKGLDAYKTLHELQEDSYVSITKSKLEYQLKGWNQR